MSSAAPDFTAYLGLIPSGSEGINATLKVMVSIMRGLKSPLADPQNMKDLSDWSSRIIIGAGCPKSPPLNPCQARALRAWVQDNIYYIPDPDGLESVRFPLQTLQRGAGDCDDMALLLAALASSVGFKTRFSAWRMNAEPIPTHVSAQLLVTGMGWQNAEVIPIDSAGGGAPDIGWQPPEASFVRLAHV
jgi:Transglutaminase-like superfamily